MKVRLVVDNIIQQVGIYKVTVVVYLNFVPVST